MKKTGDECAHLWLDCQIYGEILLCRNCYLHKVFHGQAASRPSSFEANRAESKENAKEIKAAKTHITECQDAHCRHGKEFVKAHKRGDGRQFSFGKKNSPPYANRLEARNLVGTLHLNLPIGAASKPNPRHQLSHYCSLDECKRKNTKTGTLIPFPMTSELDQLKWIDGKPYHRTCQN